MRTYAIAGTSGRALSMYAKPIAEHFTQTARLVGVFDVNLSRARYFSQECGGPPVFGDFDEMIRVARPAVSLDVQDLGLSRDPSKQVSNGHRSCIEGIFVLLAGALNPLRAPERRRSVTGGADEQAPTVGDGSPKLIKVAVEGDLPLMDHHDPPGELLEVGHIMAGDHDGHVLLAIRLSPNRSFLARRARCKRRLQPRPSGRSSNRMVVVAGAIKGRSSVPAQSIVFSTVGQAELCHSAKSQTRVGD